MKKSGDSRRILLVDDDPETVRLIVDQLQQHKTQKFSILTAGNASEALSATAHCLTQREAIDVIVSDFDMPHMDGLALLHSVRQTGIEAPFVILAESAHVEKARQALRHGALDILDKPHNQELLIRTVDKAMQLSELLRLLDQELKKESVLVKST